MVETSMTSSQLQTATVVRFNLVRHSRLSYMCDLHIVWSQGRKKLRRANNDFHFSGGDNLRRFTQYDHWPSFMISAIRHRTHGPEDAARLEFQHLGALISSRSVTVSIGASGRNEWIRQLTRQFIGDIVVLDDVFCFIKRE